jgi:calcium-dependent protein kinase
MTGLLRARSAVVSARCVAVQTRGGGVLRARHRRLSLAGRRTPPLVAPRRTFFSAIFGGSSEAPAVARQFDDIRQLYALGNVLGEGTYGSVSVAEEAGSGRRVALKAIEKVAVETSMITNEVDMMQRLKGSPWVMDIYDIYEDPRFVWMALPLYEGQELYSRIVANCSTGRTFSERHAAIIIAQILKAVEHCHSKNVIHRDIKPENIMFRYARDDGGRDEEEGDEGGGDGTPRELEVVLVDMGCARCFSHVGATHAEQMGSPPFMAPEMVSGHYDERVDLWSVGAVLYMMLCGELPFEGDRSLRPNERRADTLRKIGAGEGGAMEGPVWAGVSSEAKALCLGLMEPSPGRRLSAQAALSSEWVVRQGMIGEARSVPRQVGMTAQELSHKAADEQRHSSPSRDAVAGAKLELKRASAFTVVKS